MSVHRERALVFNVLERSSGDDQLVFNAQAEFISSRTQLLSPGLLLSKLIALISLPNGRAIGALLPLAIGRAHVNQ